MAKLTSEMKVMFEKQLAVVATASGDGTPNVGTKGSMHVVDDETLRRIQGDWRCRQFDTARSVNKTTTSRYNSMRRQTPLSFDVPRADF